jgi:hypothetical protein
MMNGVIGGASEGQKISDRSKQWDETTRIDSAEGFTNYDHMSIKNFDEEEGAADELGGGGSKKLREVNIPILVTLLIGGLIAIFILIACLISAIHRVHEGHVGLYFRNGALLDEVSDPGVHWAQPFVTTVEYLLIRPETEVLDPMVCTTRDGVRNVFRDVQVISSIKKDKVRI